MSNYISVLLLAFAGLQTVSGTPQEPGAVDELEDVVLGATIVTLSEKRDAFKDADVRLPTSSGVLITHVVKHGPAHTAGLAAMDVITRINKTTVATAEEFKTAVSALDPSEDCEVTGYRAVISRSGRVSWKRGSVTTKPVKRRDLFLNAMRTKTDEVRQSVSYTHKDSAEFVNKSTEMYCYVIREKDASPVLRLHLQYVADDWLFIQRFLVRVDDRTFVVTPPRFGGVERDNSGGKIWEWYDQVADKDTLEMLTAVANSRKAIVRFEGDKYQKDLEITDADRERIGLVLRVLQILSPGQPR
jgi:hypothetical protein